VGRVERDLLNVAVGNGTVANAARVRLARTRAIHHPQVVFLVRLDRDVLISRVHMKISRERNHPAGAKIEVVTLLRTATGMVPAVERIRGSEIVRWLQLGGQFDEAVTVVCARVVGVENSVAGAEVNVVSTVVITARGQASTPCQMPPPWRPSISGDPGVVA
jgi:hypothetical protein